MNFCFAVIFLLIPLIDGYSQPIIENTRKEGCIDEIRCGPHCEYDGVKLFPNESAEQKGKCRFLRCNEKFQVYLTECPFDSELLNSESLQIYD